jgi:hypothetical protein
MGDMASAAQAQLSIKKIQEDRQRELTRTSISDKYQKQIDAKNKEIEELQKKADLLSNGVASSAKNAATKSANLAAIQDYRDRINAVVTRNPDGKISGSDQKILMAIFEEMKSAGGAIAKAAEEMLAPYKGTSGLPDLVNGKPRVPISPAVKLAKDLADKTANKEGVFETAVDKFIAAVNVFAGVTGMPYSPPGDTSKPLKLGPIPTGLKSNYMRFSSGDGKKKIQVAVTTSDSESAYADYISNGWKFIEYSTTKNKSTEYSYSKLNPFNKVPKAAMGGLIKKYDFGGNVSGPGTPTSDSIPAMLSDGEYVIKASSVDKAQKEFGSDFFDTINAGRFAEGGEAKKQGFLNKLIFGDNSPKYFKNPKTGNMELATVLKGEVPFGPGNLAKIIPLLSKYVGVGGNVFLNQSEVAAITKAASSMNLGSPQTLFRGTTTNLSHLKPGDIYDRARYMSTSLSESAANMFSHTDQGIPSLIKIITNASTKGIDINKLGLGHGLEAEKEILLGAGKFRVMANEMVEDAGRLINKITMESVSKFSNGGMATPKYNVPSSSLSIGNNQNMGYNKGGSIHHYNAGGIVVNGAQGQDVKELASHIVTIMDARGSRRNSMNGGGITV